jgi:hypothetical protein
MQQSGDRVIGGECGGKAQLEYVPIAAVGSELLFEVLSRRYEAKSLTYSADDYELRSSSFERNNSAI